MTLAHKIMMCLNLWLPPEGMHVESQDLLSYWYNQRMEMVDQSMSGIEPPWRIENPLLKWETFEQRFSLPNSDYLPIPECIWSESWES